MALGCKSSIGCIVDSCAPVRATYANLYRPESDAEFVRSVIIGQKNPKRWASSPRVVDGYSCRQMYLRSYRFSKYESVPEKTRKCFVRVKEKAVDFPSFILRSSSLSSVEDVRVRSKKRNGTKNACKKKGTSCPMATKFRDASSAAFRSIFRRLLSCTASVDVADQGSPAVN